MSRLYPVSPSLLCVRQPRAGAPGTLISGLRHLVLQARSCGADLEDHQSVFRTLWRVHRSWSIDFLAEFRAPICRKIVLSVATSGSLHDVPELFLFTLISFHCLLRPAEARQLRSCDVETFLADPCQHVTNSGTINITEPKTCRMTGHAAQQHVLLECPAVSWSFQ